MNKQEVMKHIRNLLTKELNEASRDSWISNEQGIKLQNTHYEILEYLDSNLYNDWEFKLTPSVEFPLEPGTVVTEENNIRRIVRDEMYKVLRREHYLQK